MTVTDDRYSIVVRRPATIGRRIVACAIDSAIAVLILLIAVGIFAGISFGTGGAFPLALAGGLGYLVAAAWFVVYTLMQGGAGSLGMRALGLRLAHVSDDARLGFGRALGRNLVWGLGNAIVVGLFSPLFDGSEWRRGWYDIASGAVMTDVAGHASPAAARPPLPTPSVPRVAPAAAGAPVAPVVPATPAAPPSAPVPAGHGLPAAPILPVGDAPALGDGAAVAPVRSGESAASLIAFVPGVTDPAVLDAPAPAAPRGIPVVDAAPASAATPTPTEQPALARLVWDDGTRQALYGRTVFGRNPAPETGAMVSPVRDETLSLSKTHFELDGDAERGLWVTDRHSTNGVVVRRGAQRQTAASGEPVRVRRGDVLEFGDRSVTIEAAS